MNIVERIELLCEEQETTFAAVERKCGLSNGSIRRWGTNTPSTDKIQKVADYFNVSLDFLQGRTDYRYVISDKVDLESALNEKDKKDISKKMQSILEDLDSDQEALMFDGEVLDEETKELLKNSLKSSLEMGKVIAKQKFTPKKYRK